MIEKNIISERGTVYYWINENAVPNDLCIVFCHGLTADHTLFDKQIDFFSKLYRVITWDFPLHGKSRPYRDFLYDNVSCELKAILDKENIDRIVLVGQSAGGYIAQAYVEKYPERVKGFVGIGTTPFGKEYYKESELFWIRHFKGIAKLYPYGYYCSTCSKGVTYTEEAKKSIYKTLKNLGKKDMLEAVGAVYGEFLNSVNPVTFNCPVLLTYGEFDKTGYVKKYNKKWSEKEGYPIQVIEKASHNANYDNYEGFNELLIDFITTEVCSEPTVRGDRVTDNTN